MASEQSGTEDRLDDGVQRSDVLERVIARVGADLAQCSA